MKLTRFGVLGAHPRQVSRLTRHLIEELTAAGAELVVWIEGEPEAALPWGLDQPGPVSYSLEVYPAAQADKALVRQPVDFLLQLGVSPEPIYYSQPAHGVWRLTTASPGPLAFWDVYDGLFHIEIRLEKIAAEESCAVLPLERRWLRVDRLSYTKTVDALVTEMVEMVTHVARCGPPTDIKPVVYPPQHNDWPTSVQMAILKMKLAWRNLAYQVRSILFSESWSIGLTDATATEFLDMGYLPKTRWLPVPARNRFLADPFLARMPDGWLLLAEDFDFTTNLGRIAQEFSRDGQFTGAVEDAIVEPCHMSYPFPLEYEGELYCIPETHQLNGVFAWRWDAAKHGWNDRRQILAGRQLVDSSIIFFEDRWWLFATDKQNGVNSKLHVFFSASPFGPWEPHARNPVKVDVRSSRPGGKPFVAAGQLYRPAQDSSKHYGWRLMLNQVIRLTPTEFEEDTIRVVDSDRLGASGVHTLSGASDGRAVIDVWKPRIIPGRVWSTLLHKLRYLTGYR